MQSVINNVAAQGLKSAVIVLQYGHTDKYAYYK